MSVISDIHGREVLDSRGYPALEVDLTLNNTVQVRAAVPSGASTGSHEALELRDHDSCRFKGKGLLKALSHINILSDELKKHSFNNQSELDAFLIKWDGTQNKSRVGANTILAVSLAYAKARALSGHQELFESFGTNNYMLPVPLINILNGGVHANNGLSVQEFMIVPYGFDSFKEALRAASEVFYCLKQLLREQGFNTSVGDEGGFAPLLTNNESALKLLLQAIEEGGYSSENQIALALDVAASEFYEGGKYRWEKESIEAADLINIYKHWEEQYPLISIEDGLAEEDWAGWVKLTKELGKSMQLVGDDLFVTHERRLKKGIDKGVANCLLAKINQVGTLTETHSAIQLAYEAGYNCCISHRSGETEDVSIADLAVAWGVKQIKTGSVCRGERVAKYNRCLRIEEKLKNQVEFAGKKAFSFL
ncbi:MAG: phosphopyruvate hydratase [Bdellovibrionales bacterium]|nr:phosphopyruvate hydratase [Bdellovibrionales bacterium]